MLLIFQELTPTAIPHPYRDSHLIFISCSPIQLRRNDIQTAQHRHHVAQGVPADQVRKQGEVDKRRRTAAGPLGPFGCRRRRYKTPTRRWAPRWRRTPPRTASRSRGWSSPTRNARSAPRSCENTLPLSGRIARRSRPRSPARRADSRSPGATIFRLSLHLGHPHQVAGEAVARRRRSKPGNRNRGRPNTARPCGGRGSRRWPGRRARCNCG